MECFRSSLRALLGTILLEASVCRSVAFIWQERATTADLKTKFIFDGGIGRFETPLSLRFFLSFSLEDTDLKCLSLCSSRGVCIAAQVPLTAAEEHERF